MQDATSAHVCTQQRWDAAGMPQEAASAHVCTCSRVPVLGEIVLTGDEIDIDALRAKWEQSFAPFRQPILEGIDLVAGGHERPPTNWPGLRTTLLSPVERTHDATAYLHGDAQLSDCYYYRASNGEIAAAAQRHNGEQAQKWTCHLYCQGQTGGEWLRAFQAVAMARKTIKALAAHLLTVALATVAAAVQTLPGAHP